MDTAWLHMEDPANLMMVTGLLVFDEPLDFSRIRHRVDVAVRSVPRLSQRVVDGSLPIGPPHWEADPLFDAGAHLHRIALPRPGGRRELERLVSDLMSTPLDLARPLWQLHVVEGRGRSGKGSALLFRVHHALGDGFALVSLLLSFLDGAHPPLEEESDGPDFWGRLRAIPEAALAPALDAMRATLVPGSRHDGPLHPTISSLVAPIQDRLTRAGRELTATLRGAAHLLGTPERALDLTWNVARGVDAFAKLLLMSPDPRTPLKGTLGTAKKAAWMRPFPLEDVKAIGRTLGGTVNDVLVTATAGGLRRYLLGRGVPLQDVEIRAVVPVNLRPPGEEHPVGNRFGLVFLPLPVGISGAIERFDAVRNGMDELKGSPEALVAFGLLTAIGAVPADVEKGIVELFGTRGTLVLTNVPGPKEPLTFTGRRVREVMFWVPQSGRLGLGISILSYAGKVSVGVAADAALIPDPQKLLADVEAELTALRLLSRPARRKRQSSTAAAADADFK